MSVSENMRPPNQLDFPLSIVFSLKSHPKGVPGLTKRHVDRFPWGRLRARGVLWGATGIRGRRAAAGGRAASEPGHHGTGASEAAEPGESVGRGISGERGYGVVNGGGAIGWDVRLQLCDFTGGVGRAF